MKLKLPVQFSVTSAKPIVNTLFQSVTPKEDELYLTETVGTLFCYFSMLHVNKHLYFIFSLQIQRQISKPL